MTSKALDKRQPAASRTSESERDLAVSGAIDRKTNTSAKGVCTVLGGTRHSHPMFDLQSGTTGEVRESYVDNIL